MDIFNIDSYRKIIKNWVSRQPKKGWGIHNQLATHLSIPASVFSQILKGTRELPLEGAYQLCEIMQFIEIEKEYFLALVQREKSSHHKLKNYFQKKIEKIREDSKNLKHRVHSDLTLSEHEQSVFYSSWIYSAIRMRCSLKNKPTLDSLVQEFGLSKEIIQKAISFLLSKGLILGSNGQFDIGAAMTYISKDSPHISKHHTNWRLRAIQKSGNLETRDFMFTAPLSCSDHDYDLIRQKISQCIQEISQIVKESEPEKIVYLGIDFIAP